MSQAGLSKFTDRYGHMLAVMGVFACVQGGILLSQLLSALYLEPAEVGMVRTLESSMALVIAAVSLGMPALAVRIGAQPAQSLANGELLSQLLITVAGTGAIAWLALVIVAPWLGRFGGKWLGLLAGVAILTNSGRVLAGFVQGAAIQRKVYFSLAIVTTVSVAALFLLARNWGLAGWVVGRYLMEAALVACLGAHVAPALKACWGRRNLIRPSRSLLADGALLNIALFIRLACDSLPFMIFVGSAAAMDDVGYLGMAQLLLVGPNLLFAVAGQIYLPRLMATAATLEGEGQVLRQQTLVLLGIAAVSIACLVGAWKLVTVFWVNYQPALELALAQAPALIFRALALTLGNWMMALRHYKMTVLNNIIELATSGVIALLLVMKFEALGAALSVVVGAALSAAAYLAGWDYLRTKRAGT